MDSPVQIFDPLTTKFDSASNTSSRTPFPNNVIPTSQIDPTAGRFLKEIWQPNNPGDDITGVNNYKYRPAGDQLLECYQPHRFQHQR